MPWTGFLICLLLFWPYLPGLVASFPGFKLGSLEVSGIILNQNWKFHQVDNPMWADPDFDNSNWSSLDPTTDIHYLTDLRETEIGWFRLHLEVDESLLNTPMALNIFQRGASEICLNGKLIHKLGVVSQNPKKEVIFNSKFHPLWSSV